MYVLTLSVAYVVSYVLPLFFPSAPLKIIFLGNVSSTDLFSVPLSFSLYSSACIVNFVLASNCFPVTASVDEVLISPSANPVNFLLFKVKLLLLTLKLTLESFPNLILVNLGTSFIPITIL